MLLFSKLSIFAFLFVCCTSPTVGLACEYDDYDVVASEVFELEDGLFIDELVLVGQWDVIIIDDLTIRSEPGTIETDGYYIYYVIIIDDLTSRLLLEIESQVC